MGLPVTPGRGVCKKKKQASRCREYFHVDRRASGPGWKKAVPERSTRETLSTYSRPGQSQNIGLKKPLSSFFSRRMQRSSNVQRERFSAGHLPEKTSHGQKISNKHQPEETGIESVGSKGENGRQWGAVFVIAPVQREIPA